MSSKILDTSTTTDREPEMSREEKIEHLSRMLWRTSDEKLDVIAAVLDLC